MLFLKERILPIPKLANISKTSDCSTERRKTRAEGREVAIIGGANPYIKKVFSSFLLLFREMNIIFMSILLALPSEPEFVNLLRCHCPGIDSQPGGI
jgi:hypothetical protein